MGQNKSPFPFKEGISTADHSDHQFKGLKTKCKPSILNFRASFQSIYCTESLHATVRTGFHRAHSIYSTKLQLAFPENVKKTLLTIIKQSELSAMLNKRNTAELARSLPPRRAAPLRASWAISTYASTSVPRYSQPRIDRSSRRGETKVTRHRNISTTNNVSFYTLPICDNGKFANDDEWKIFFLNCMMCSN